MSSSAEANSMTAMEYVADLVAVEGVSTALVAGVGATFLLNANAPEAVTFGALAALSKSVGSYILTVAGAYVNLNTYFGQYGAELDPNDFIATAVVIGGVTYFTTGLTGVDLYKTMGVGGVAGVLSPKLAAQLHYWAYDPKSGKKGAANQSN
jgi:hypothetical protein